VGVRRAGNFLLTYGYARATRKTLTIEH